MVDGATFQKCAVVPTELKLGANVDPLLNLLTEGYWNLGFVLLEKNGPATGFGLLKLITGG